MSNPKAFAIEIMIDNTMGKQKSVWTFVLAVGGLQAALDSAQPQTDRTS